MNKNALKIWLIMIIILLVSVPSFSNTTVFPDIEKDWAKDEIIYLHERGYISGFEDGLFRPRRIVDRDQFIRMTIGDEKYAIRDVSTGEYWATRYIEKAHELGIIDLEIFGDITPNNYAKPIKREEMASIITRAYLLENPAPSSEKLKAAESMLTDLDQVSEVFYEDVLVAIALNLIQGFPEDKTFRPQETAERNQSAAVLYRFLNLNSAQDSEHFIAIKGIGMGDSVEKVQKTFGEPIRKEQSTWPFQWWVYHQNYDDYFAIGIENNRVVALLATSNQVNGSSGIRMGQNKEKISSLIGKPVESILKDNTHFLQYNTDETSVHFSNQQFITVYYDTYQKNQSVLIQVIDEGIERSFTRRVPSSSQEVLDHYNHMVFDLANVFRRQHQLPVLTWSDEMSRAAFLHSKDMAENHFFAHTNLKGEKAHDRIFRAMPQLRASGENIAAGHPTPIHAHASWINSKTGHRENILANFTHLGVGTYIGGDYLIYITQNMYRS